MTSQAVMKRYLTSVAKNNEEYKDNKTIQYLASLISNYKKLDAEDKEVLDAKIESAYNKLQAKGVSASKSTSKATTTRRTKSSSDGGLKGILADLKKKLGAEKFRDATRGTDIQKDIKIPALKKGKRIVRKKGYTSNFYGRFKNKVGSTYYENRANRYDANQPSQTRKYKLADGGSLGNIGDPFSFDVKAKNKNGENVERTMVSYSSNEKMAKEKLLDFLTQKLKYTNVKILNGRKGHHPYAKGGKTSDVNYNDILPILKEKLEDGVETLLPNDFENSSEYKGEEVESKSRDGFIAFTDGGYEVTWFEYVSMFNGGGYKLPTKALDNEMQRQVEYNYQYAKDRIKDLYPEIVEKLGEDNIDYSSLYDAGYESIAEQLSEYEMDNDDTIMCRVGAYYYSPENSRSKDGKHTIRVFGVVNLESPYHRRGNLEDSIDIDITFDSIEEMEEKLDYEISEICSGWFNGANYNESTEKLRIVRMAKGGKLSSKAKYIPNRDIAEIEIERNGKSKSIDGANILDGVYVKKGTKFADGGAMGIASYRNHKVGDFVEVWGYGGKTKLMKIVGFEDGKEIYLLESEDGKSKSVTPKKYIANLSGEFPLLSSSEKHKETMRNAPFDENTYQKGYEFAKGGEVAQKVFVAKEDGILGIFSGSDAYSIEISKGDTFVTYGEQDNSNWWYVKKVDKKSSAMSENNDWDYSKSKSRVRVNWDEMILTFPKGDNMIYAQMDEKFAKGGEVKTPIKIKKQLESIRKSIQNENVSYAELAELQSLSKYIDPNDIELREWAGIPEFEDGEEFAKGGTTKRIKRKGC
jgi:hypothetical protein